MSDLPRLETARLVLRVPTPDDAEAMAAFVTANRKHFAPWDPLHGEAYFTVEHWRGELVRGVEQARLGTALQFVLESKEDPSGRIAGQCTLSGIARGPFQAAYLGYGLDHRAVGKGLMEEALREAIRFGFEQLNLHRIMANYMPANTRSARLLDKLGFVREGFARDYLRLAGRWQDHVLTAFVNPAWKEDGAR